jgi:hypothetical protein
MQSPHFSIEELGWRIRRWSDERVRLGNVEIPAEFDAHLEHPGWPTAAVLTVTVDPDRGPIASGLQVRRRQGQSTDVPSYRELDKILSSTIEIARLLRDTTADAVASVVMDQLDAELHPLAELTDDERLKRARTVGEQARLAADRAWEHTRPARRRVISRQHLVAVATAYREAIDGGLPPTRHVADRFHTSHSTASKWVRMARDAQVLGAAIGTKPGEVTE